MKQFSFTVWQQFLTTVFILLWSASASTYAADLATETKKKVAPKQSVSHLVDDERASKLLTDMSTALRERNYSGRLVYMVSNHMSSFEVQHALIKGQEYEKLVFLNQHKQEVVRVGHELFCIHPGNHMLRQDKALANTSLSSNPLADKFTTLGKDIFKNYDVSISSGDMVAGLEAISLHFKAKDENRYDHQLWLDAETNILLKVAVMDRLLGSLESFEFVQMDINTKLEEKNFEHKGYVRHKAVHSGHNDAVDQKESAWKATWLPSGFHLTGVQKRKFSENSVAVLTYTDGLVGLSVFVDELPLKAKNGKDDVSETSQMGAMSAYSHSVYALDSSQKPVARYVVTVIGDVSLRAVERVAKGMALK